MPKPKKSDSSTAIAGFACGRYGPFARAAPLDAVAPVEPVPDHVTGKAQHPKDPPNNRIFVDEE